MDDAGGHFLILVSANIYSEPWEEGALSFEIKQPHQSDSWCFDIGFEIQMSVTDSFPHVV
jgi:hypothetical protein